MIAAQHNGRVLAQIRSYDVQLKQPIYFCNKERRVFKDNVGYPKQTVKGTHLMPNASNLVCYKLKILKYFLAIQKKEKSDE